MTDGKLTAQRREWKCRSAVILDDHPHCWGQWTGFAMGMLSLAVVVFARLVLGLALAECLGILLRPGDDRRVFTSALQNHAADLLALLSLDARQPARLRPSTVIKQQQRVCPSRYTAFGFPIPHQGGEFCSGCFIKKTAANHVS